MNENENFRKKVLGLNVAAAIPNSLLSASVFFDIPPNELKVERIEILYLNGRELI